MAEQTSTSPESSRVVVANETADEQPIVSVAALAEPLPADIGEHVDAVSIL